MILKKSRPICRFSFLLVAATSAPLGCASVEDSNARRSETEEHVAATAQAVTDRCNEGPGHVPDGGGRFNRAAEYITGEMNRNKVAALATIRPSIEAGNRAAALATWGWLVQSDGQWDHKPKLRGLFGMSLDREETLYTDLPSGNRELFYDVWSNIHYGFVGTLAGITRLELQTAANLSDGVTGVNDSADVTTIDIGIELARELGPVAEVTSTAVVAALLAQLDSLRAADCYHVRAYPPVPPVPIECFVFNDGYSDMAGPSEAVYFRGPRQACIGDGSPGGLCRKWFGRCRTKDTHEPVALNTFSFSDDNRVNGVDALFPGPGGGSGDVVCAPDGSRSGTCGIAFFVSGVSGRRSWCRLYDDGYTRSVYEAEFMSPSAGRVCDIPTVGGGEQEQPICRKWFACEAEALPAPKGEDDDDGTPEEPPLAVSAGGDVSGVEGTPISLSGSVSGSANPTVTWSWRAGAGAQRNARCTISNASSLRATITCNDDGNYVATLTASDAGRAARSDSVIVRVENAPPELTLVGPSPWQVFRVGGQVRLAASFTDPGSNDSHVCTVDWDDGTSETYAAASGNCNRAHTYTRPGMYTKKVTVTDDDGASDQASVMVIVYDPKGAFANADGSLRSTGGWPFSPPATQSESWFNFAARYYGNATTPTGNARAWLVGTDFRLDSGTSGLEWLVATNDGKMAARGRGKLQGKPGEYGFVFYGYDGCINAPSTGCLPGVGDLFRVAVWDRSVSEHPGTGVIFDNVPNGDYDLDSAAPQPLMSGIVTIHPPT